MGNTVNLSDSAEQRRSRVGWGGVDVGGGWMGVSIHTHTLTHVYVLIGPPPSQPLQSPGPLEAVVGIQDTSNLFLPPCMQEIRTKQDTHIEVILNHRMCFWVSRQIKSFVKDELKI